MSGAVNTGGGTPASELFRGRTIIWIVMAGVIGLALFIILSTYAPDYRPPSRMQVPAIVQSKAGNGFAGLKKWLEAHDYDVPDLLNEPVSYAPSQPDAESSEEDADIPLMIVTLEADTTEERIEEIARLRRGQPTLYILPKYYVRQKKDHEGWAEKVFALPPGLADQKIRTIQNAYGLAQEDNENADQNADPNEGSRPTDHGSETTPRNAQQLIIDDKAVDTKTTWRTIDIGSPIVVTGEHKNVMIELDEDAAVYVLVDPDLMNNAGLADPNVAHAALDAIDSIATSDIIEFDTTTNIAGKSKYSLMKLMLEPPFLALTLTILFATLLAVLNGLGRFGPPRVPQRVFAYGKKSLVDMTALMMRRGHKLGGLAPNYLALVRGRAGEALGAPANLSAEALDQWLEDTDRTDGNDWRSLVQEAGSAHGPQQVKSIAQRLYDWKARRISER